MIDFPCVISHFSSQAAGATKPAKSRSDEEKKTDRSSVPKSTTKKTIGEKPKAVVLPAQVIGERPKADAANSSQPSGEKKKVQKDGVIHQEPPPGSSEINHNNSINSHSTAECSESVFTESSSSVAATTPPLTNVYPAAMAVPPVIFI